MTITNVAPHTACPDRGLSEWESYKQEGLIDSINSLKLKKQARVTMTQDMRGI